jgi:D-alanyl-D-alanine carboxypeptidase (penicillin-binding protein 5/6)
MLKRLLCLLAVCALLFGTLIPVHAEEISIVDPFNANNSAVAYCIDTRQVLYAHKEEQIHAPGVVTKLMALLVAGELVEATGRPLSYQVSVKQEWLTDTYTPGDRSSPYLGLSSGDTCTLEYLFACSLVSNANDACSVLVNYCAEELMFKTEADFLERMNARAVELGMENTYFEDTIGFGGKGRTTAADTVKLLAAFYLRDELVKLADCSSYGSIRNKNYLENDKFLKGYKTEKAMGLIAGQSTNDGGYHLVTFCEKDGIAYAYVAMGGGTEHIDADGTRWFDTGNVYEDMLGMIPYVEGTYSFVRLCAGQGETDVTFLADLRMGGGAEENLLRLVPAQTVEMMVANPTGAKIQVKISYDKEKVYESEIKDKTYMTVDAPVQQGDVLGKATFLLEGKELATVDVLAEKSVEVNTLLKLKLDMEEFLFGGTAGVIVRILLVILGIWVFFAIAYWIYHKVLVWYKKRNVNKDVNKL